MSTEDIFIVKKERTDENGVHVTLQCEEQDEEALNEMKKHIEALILKNTAPNSICYERVLGANVYLQVDANNLRNITSEWTIDLGGSQTEMVVDMIEAADKVSCSLSKSRVGSTTIKIEHGCLKITTY